MKINLKGYKVDDETNYKIVSIEKCCDKILHSHLINLRNEFMDECYISDIPSVAITETIPHDDTWDEDKYHRISHCPFCGEKIEIIIDEIIDATDEYNKIQKEENEYCYRANNCDSKNEERELRQKIRELSNKANRYLTTDIWNVFYNREEDD